MAGLAHYTMARLETHTHTHTNLCPHYAGSNLFLAQNAPVTHSKHPCAQPTYVCVISAGQGQDAGDKSR